MSYIQNPEEIRKPEKILETSNFISQDIQAQLQSQRDMIDSLTWALDNAEAKVTGALMELDTVKQSIKSTNYNTAASYRELCEFLEDTISKEDHPSLIPTLINTEVAITTATSKLT